ncbi:MAG TPA: alkaline shock response membrane anchor protein AmaP [Candidatus Bathyarchaeia archaeon]|nr:alkaline shock response membrane anchor protein AmaP [Candidatus Bathyarchaeia archaeon]
MRIVHIVVFKLLSLVVLAAGVLLVAMYFQVPLYERVIAFVDERWVQLAPVGGSLLFILGLLGLLPLSRKKRRNTISFPGEYGEVTIHLDSIEATLNRIVSKMPEVKKISVRLIPSEDNRRAEVTGSLWIYKGSEAAGVSEIVGKVQKHLRDTAINILGVEEIVMGKLDVPGIIVSVTPAQPAPPVETKEAHPAPVPVPPVVEERAAQEPVVSTAFEPEETHPPEEEPAASNSGGEEETH